MEFSKKLRKLRSEKGLSQQMLANEVFVSRSAVAKWENGLGLPSEESFAALAKFFGVSPESLRTNRPEAIVVEKNKKIKKLVGAVCVIGVTIAFLLIVYLMFHPVPFYASAGWDSVEVQTVSEPALTFEITDDHTVNGLIDALNAVHFRKSLHLSHEAPNHLQAVFYMRNDEGEGTDLWLCSSGADRFYVYIWDGSEELVACHTEELAAYLCGLMETPVERE